MQRSAAPMLFRWLLEDAIAEVAEAWSRAGGGWAVDGRLLHHLCWADDTWLFSETSGHLPEMLRDLEEAAAKVGLAIRWSKCTWQEVVRPIAPEVLAQDAETRLLAAYIQTQGNG